MWSWLRRKRGGRPGDDPGIECVQLVELVTDYIENALPPALHDRVTAHLAACVDCSTYFQQMVQAVAALRGAHPDPDPSLSEAECADLVERFRTWADSA